MSIFSVDIEADGPNPLQYNMIQVGVVLVDPERKLDKTFYGEFKPRTDNYKDEALNVVGVSHEHTLTYPNAEITMKKLAKWIAQVNIKGKPRMMADNAGFDWMFVNTYFHQYCGANPFGFSCLSLTSMFKGFEKDYRANFKHLRKTKHTHNPVDDAMGNAEAFLAIIDKGFECKL